MVAPCLLMKMNSLLAALGERKGWKRNDGKMENNLDKTVNGSHHVYRCP